MNEYDFVIVGAGKSCEETIPHQALIHITGIHGLTMLKTYRDVHPEATTLLLDKANSIGGVWAEDRLYPGLHTNNHFRTYVALERSKQDGN